MDRGDANGRRVAPMSDTMLFIISLGITILGFGASYGMAQRRGLASGLRGASWSMVPLAATMTGVTEFVTDLVFSPAKWAGIVLAGLAVVLYMTSGVMLRRGLAKEEGRPAVQERAGRRERGRERPGRAVEKPSRAPAADPEMREIEDILRRRGIN